MPIQNTARLRVRGWGADLDPANRPAVPKEKIPTRGTGAHWEEPERQMPKIPILRSVEHKGLTPVFGTSCPPRGVSGLLRRYAYTLSEGRSAHWLLLMFADRVDVFEGIVLSLFRGTPHNPLKEMGLGAELKRHGMRSRLGHKRADVRRWRSMLILFTAAISLLFARRAYGRKA